MPGASDTSSVSEGRTLNKASTCGLPATILHNVYSLSKMKEQSKKNELKKNEKFTTLKTWFHKQIESISILTPKMMIC